MILLWKWLWKLLAKNENNDPKLGNPTINNKNSSSSESIKSKKEESDKKAKEEADKKAKEESDKKAKEDADKKAKEDADKKAKEEAEKKTKKVYQKIDLEDYKTNWVISNENLKKLQLASQSRCIQQYQAFVCGV